MMKKEEALVSWAELKDAYDQHPARSQITSIQVSYDFLMWVQIFETDSRVYVINNHKTPDTWRGIPMNIDRDAAQPWEIQD